MRKKSIIKGFIRRGSDGKVLVLRRSATGNRRPGDWDFPGGTIDPGEDIYEAGEREALEESGLSVKIAQDDIVYCATSVREDLESANSEKVLILHFMFSVKVDGDPKVTLSHEHDQFIWVDESELHQFLPNSAVYVDAFRLLSQENPGLIA